MVRRAPCGGALGGAPDLQGGVPHVQRPAAGADGPCALPPGAVQPVRRTCWAALRPRILNGGTGRRPRLTLDRRTSSTRHPAAALAPRLPLHASLHPPQ